jgi:hypothetical protein
MHCQSRKNPQSFNALPQRGCRRSGASKVLPLGSIVPGCDSHPDVSRRTTPRREIDALGGVTIQNLPVLLAQKAKISLATRENPTIFIDNLLK